jgi:putative transposase
MKWNLRLAAANRSIWKASELQRMLAHHGLVISAGKMSGLWSGQPAKRMRRAYHAESALAAQAQMEALAVELERTHPGAAASLREGMEDTLTVLRLGVPPTLARTLRSNTIESMISICRDHASNVKNWRDGQMALRWCAAGMVEAGKQFRRVNGHLHLPWLRTALDRHVAAETVGAACHDQTMTAA